MAGINLDRGVETRRHPSGIEVNMYIDEPGVYLSSHGTELPEAIAKGAGFPVEDLALAKLKKERLAEAHAKIEREYSVDGDVESVVKETDNGWKLVGYGKGRFNVVDPEGNKLSPTPLTQDIAETVFDDFTKVKKEAVEPPKPNGKEEDKNGQASSPSVKDKKEKPAA